MDAVKIGMLGSADIAEVVADRLEDLPCPIVFDPVMVATSGSVLADAATIAVFEWLMELATLTTPNVPELAALGGAAAMVRTRVWPISPRAAMPKARWWKIALLRPGLPDAVWSEARIVTKHTHGTGCTLSSAIALHLARGLPLEEAVAEARRFVRAALMAAPGYGLGNGPLGHQAVRP